MLLTVPGMWVRRGLFYHYFFGFGVCAADVEAGSGGGAGELYAVEAEVACGSFGVGGFDVLDAFLL